jgi:hypothetical protein
MARQCGLNKRQFVNLIERPLARMDYEAILRKTDKW